MKSDKVVQITAFAAILLGGILLLINIYGLTQDIRPATIQDSELRFHNDVSLTYDDAKKAIPRKEGETEEQYAERMTFVISQTLAHIQWNEEQDPRKYNQRIPVWENYFLYVMALVSGIPEFEKYHYANYDLSLKRGIGICGDASMVMSQILNQQNIPNQIITFPGHVVIEASFNDGATRVFDPDFGVALPYSTDEINSSPALVRAFYSAEGYTEKEVNTLNWLYGKDYQRWNGVSHFITKKYYFEKFAYFMKWPLPILLILGAAGVLYLNKRRRINKSS
ncbi:hypothetical protein BTA51_10405 [Hahella sp. CCB-MM4]|uniref:hypothetical protein n=1 Tax=Hahella sp. (strain CCB-MM4) TaxID=1926491 RepID=UPI000B9C3960|nr:hypothetical protein [Hahella sp. CCB-MM4]OZG73428.1 hypothetical protein BTA51_10405 [Hahella sp. CCB-MM4]